MIVVYDIETFKNCFTITFYEVDKDTFYQYVISKLRNDFKQLEKYIQYLYQHDAYLVGFNSLNFDYPVLHRIIEEDIQDADIIYNIAQSVINTQFAAIPHWQEHLKQIDLFRINHYNNFSRSTSLKSLQIAMNLDDVQDMPYDHTYAVTTLKEVDEILAYNKWDVYSTYKFYLLNIDRIKLRTELSQMYDLHLLNSPDVSIGENLFLKFLSEDMEVDKKILKKQRTYRSSIIFKDIILPYIKYDNKILSNLLDEFKSIVITNTKKGFKKSLKLHNEIFEFAQGGLHQCTKPGIYESTADIVILDIDVE